MKTSHLFAFLGGAAIGAVIALLLAPDSGKATRAKIDAKLKEKGIHLSSEKLDQFINELKERLNLKIDDDIVMEDDKDGK